MRACGVRHHDYARNRDFTCTLPADHRPAWCHEEELEGPSGVEINWWRVYPGDICKEYGCGNAASSTGYCALCVPGRASGSWRVRRLFRRLLSWCGRRT
jgi:hypothetical protein